MIVRVLILWILASVVVGAVWSGVMRSQCDICRSGGTHDQEG